MIRKETQFNKVLRMNSNKIAMKLLLETAIEDNRPNLLHLPKSKSILNKCSSVDVLNEYSHIISQMKLAKKQSKLLNDVTYKSTQVVAR